LWLRQGAGPVGAASAVEGRVGQGGATDEDMLLAELGLTGPQIAERATVVLWRDRYARPGLVGLDDAPRPGGPVRVMTPGGAG